MESKFNSAQIESRWYAQWESNGYFAPRPGGEPYCIMIPPPNVTGSLHMGHGFQESIIDALIRYHRMRGRDTLWQVGTDHAGIATQMVVERQLEAENISRRELGREAFIDKVWEWKQSSGGTITQQLRRLGASPDWSTERFTMDPGLSEAVVATFVRLHKEGLIYRGKRLVNWDPVLRTAVSDLEVLSEEEDGSLWHFRYPFADGSGHVVVATTRPETMLGDTAVAVHPDDARYAGLLGKKICLPLCDREIPLVADDYVDPEFGTGAVKITPAHDFNDYAMGQRHDLEQINIFTESATLNDEVPESYRGLDRFEARKRVVADLEQLGLLERIDPHRLKVPRGDRSGAVIEPFLTNQWFVDAKTLAGPAIEAVKSGDIQFVPRQWENTYFAWMNNIQDWCVSRQLWWGHRIPAWYDENGQCFVGASEEAVRRENDIPADTRLTQDEDVLDTWFSSGLWTFSTLGWPDDNERLQRYHPTSVLVTGFDIIFFWVARMVMLTLHLRGEVPFREVYVHGLVRDGTGQKMSKSKGNVIDPIDLIDGITLDELLQKRTAGLMQPKQAERIRKATEKQFPDGIAAYGTDALRFTYYSLAATGRDIQFDVGRIEGYRNFCNKIWNAARFVLSNCEDYEAQATTPTDEQKLALPEGARVAERWIGTELNQMLQRVEEAFARYRFDLASQALYEFFWNEYCDWYLELSKIALRDRENADLRRSTQHTLLSTLETSLRALHPLMPFITEEIWQSVGSKLGVAGDSIVLADYPEADPAKIDTDALSAVQWTKDFLLAVRGIRGEMNIAPGTAIRVLLRAGDDDDRSRLAAMEDWLCALANIDTIEWTDEGEPPAASTGLLGRLEILVPLAGLIDPEAELQRLDKELNKRSEELLRVEKKLDNPKFVANAPSEVIEKQRQRQGKLQTAISKLEQQRDSLTGL
ncbi:MAG: valine--tRNA ligase [Pseudomonadota bacterium]